MIEVHGLSYRKILSSISFVLPEQKSLAVIGHNGAGKTTLFHVLLGLKFADQGRFSLSEKKFGYVPERTYLVMEESLHSMLALHLSLISYPRAAREAEIERVITLVGLQDSLHKKFSEFSKGMLQKAMLAQAMLGSPRLIFLDEPMSGLDPGSRKEMMAHLLQLKKEGVQLVFSSHVMEDVAALADEVLMLEKGRVKA